MSIPYGKQLITAEDKQAVLDCLESDFLTQGPAVCAFEKAFAEKLDAPHAVAVSNGTAALHLAVKSLGLSEGQKVLVTPNSFVATANCVHYCGGVVEFVDISPQNHCMDLDLLECKLKADPNSYAGVIVVDFAGFPMNMERIRQLADTYKLWVVEDSCHAVAARFQKTDGSWSKVGSAEFTDACTFSFHPVKHIAAGEGGMVTTRNLELAQKIQLLRTHGITKDPELLGQNDGPWYYEMQDEGFNYRMPDLLCALGKSQLSRLDANVERRRELADRYNDAFRDLDLELPHQSPSHQHSYHLYVVRTPRRAELYEFLHERSIFCQVHYIPIYRQPVYVARYGRQQFPNCDAYYQSCLSLPMYHGLEDKDQDQVISLVKEFFGA